jgi:hypothetical protein
MTPPIRRSLYRTPKWKLEYWLRNWATDPEAKQFPKEMIARAIARKSSYGATLARRGVKIE